MSQLTCVESYIDKDQNHYGCFVIEPLEIGQGITLGNALRRTLLTDLSGFAITGARFNNLKHEFSIIKGLREDVLEVLLNLKETILKGSFLFKEKNAKIKIPGFIHAKGPVIVTAGMLKLPKDQLKVINPQSYICTIVDNSELYIEVDIENGKGYCLSNETRKRNKEEILSSMKPSTLLIDAIFTPIKRANYKIKLIHDTNGNIKESLSFEIITDGSITPKRSIYESLKILLNLVYPLFVNKDFLTISSEFAKKFYLKKKKKIKKSKKS